LKIILLIRSLHYGGAETQLVSLANGLVRRSHEVIVVTFYDRGELAARLTPGVQLRCLGKKGRWDILRFSRRLLQVVDESQANLIYSFLTTANLVASVVRSIRPKLSLVWGIRASDMDLSQYDWLAQVTGRLETMLSGYPDLIIANSITGRRHAVGMGFTDDGRFKVIPNGIDIHRFQRDPVKRERFRLLWNIPTDSFLIGIVARLDPMKDHYTFLRAAELLARRTGNIRFISVGAGTAEYRRELEREAARIGLQGKLTWLGAQDDMTGIYSALDLLCLSSAWGEGFPNALGEAMACEVPCVATNCGDAEMIIGPTGIVVARQDHVALADALEVMINKGSDALSEIGRLARARISKTFSENSAVDQTVNVLQSIL